MNKQDRLMDYLYGEMTDAERAAFEQELACDPALRAELEGLRQTRQMLAQLPEVEPAAKVLPMAAPGAGWKRWGILAAVAAALLLLLFAFNARLEWTGQGLVFALGQPQKYNKAAETPASPEAVVAALEQVLDRQEQEMEARLQSLDSAWLQRLLAREAALRQDWQDQRTQLRADQRTQMEQWERAFHPELVALIQKLQLEQQQELRLMLTDFYAEWQQTRTADLQSIEREFVNLYRKVEQNQQEVKTIWDGLGRVGD